MKIKNVEVSTVRIPLKDPKRFAQRTAFYRDYTIAHIYSDNGLEGWGYCWGTSIVSIVIKDYLKECLIGESPFEIERLWKKMFHKMSVWDRRGITSRAISVIDIALWDLIGKKLNTPIYKLIGAYREKVPVYYSGGYYPISCDTDEKLFDYIEKEMRLYYEKGFRAFKMKVGGASFDVDLKRAKIARNVIGDNSDLMIDANNAYDVYTAIKMGKEFEKIGMRWFEEPVAKDDLKNCAIVAERLNTPIAIGENHFTRWDFREIMENKAASIFQGDPTLMGGITEWLKIAGYAAIYGLSLAPHWTHDVNVQVGAARSEVLILEYFEEESDVFNFQKLLKNPIKAKNGYIYPPEGPGHGLELNKEAFEKYKI